MHKRKIAKGMLTLFSIILLLGISSLYVKQGVGGEETGTRNASQLQPQDRAQAVSMLATAEGTIEWNRTYGGSSWDEARSILQTADGGYALAGDTKSFGAGQSDVWLVKTDPRGTVEWQQTYGGFAKDWASTVIETQDGGYALAGWTESFGEDFQDAWLVKTDVQGEEEWTQTYGGAECDNAYAAIQTVDGEFALAGGTRSFGVGSYDFWFVKTGSKLDTTPPALSSHANITYEEGMTDHVIAWMVGDRHPGTYELCTNSQLVDSGVWANGTILWHVDGLNPGVYNITLSVQDAAGNSVSDTVWVTVTVPEPLPLPELPIIRILVLLSLVALVTLGVRRKNYHKLLEEQ